MIELKIFECKNGWLIQDGRPGNHAIMPLSFVARNVRELCDVVGNLCTKDVTIPESASVGCFASDEVKFESNFMKDGKNHHR